MSSPFLKCPQSEWVASNDLAFAIRDGYPVTPGHTLVIPKRLVPTWFEATPGEKVAVMDLVEVVKKQLDEELSPDGYNVGFNVGEAGGQTVWHLHVHVIPRYRGDMEDPRGGVRYVIPSRGNYKRQPIPPLSRGGEGDPFMRHLRPLFARASDIAIVAAFVQQSGLKRLTNPVDEAVRRGARVRLLTGDYLNITQSAALEDLLDWMRASTQEQDDESPEPVGCFETRVIETRRLEGRTRSFHPKSWRFEAPDTAVAFVGSSNISLAALETGIEWNLRVERASDHEAYAQIVESFEELWSKGRMLDEVWVAEYSRRAEETQRSLPAGEEEEEELDVAHEPHELQREALDELERFRRSGGQRGLVVMATGLGKTWLAVLDIDAYTTETGRQPRVLFLAHRREILRQASRAFRAFARGGGTRPRIGWFAGGSGELDGDIVFASVQKLARRQHLHSLDPDAFDYLIVDEVHHAIAPSYQRVLDHLKPGFVLGLTATPERMDEGDVLGLFDDNLVYRADIGVGIDREWLVPFDYFGLKDDVDYSVIPWRNKRFEPEVLSTALQTEHRMKRLWSEWRKHPATRTLVFCASVAHANFVKSWLVNRDVNVKVVHSGAQSDDRDEALVELENGAVDAVCSVDMLSEGVDVPKVDRVVMLRPTESPVIFLQQLGRGLRNPRGAAKERLTVIDFVGNHRVFLDRIRQLLSFAPPSERTRLDQALETDGPIELPSGCSVDVDMEAKELLRLMLPRGRTEVERVYRELHTARGARPTAGELHRLGYLPSTLRTAGGHGSWFEFVEAEGHLSDDERRALEHGRVWFRDLEKSEAMTKSFKMIVLEALLEAHALRDGLTVESLARRCHAILRRSPELFLDIQEKVRFEQLDESNLSAWIAYWKKNPIAAWTKKSAGKKRVYFSVEDGRFVSRLPIVNEAEETFARMTRELVDYRLSQYRMRQRESSTVTSFECKVTWNQRDPILKLPSRKTRPDLPKESVDVRLPDGSIWVFRLKKEFCNVARPAGTQRNKLPDLMRQWFGPQAGHPGTNFGVSFEPGPDGWLIQPRGLVIELPRRGRVVSFPDLRAAAGAAEGAVENLDLDEVVLPVQDAGDDLFVVRAAGSSMEGGARPIRDGDWLVMRYARSASLPTIVGRVVLVQIHDKAFGSRYQIKRVVRDESGWTLRSDNPNAESYPANEETVPIALLVDIVRPEDFAPSVGELIEHGGIGAAFGVDDVTKTARVDGHLFILVEHKGAFVAPDRLKMKRDRFPGETAFVLAQLGESGGWRYCGVARWLEGEGLWAIPELDNDTWSALGM